jgi:hypothetical protein
VPSEAVEKRLLNHSRAVLGRVPRLVMPRRDGVIWAPADDKYVAGELLLDSAEGVTWAIKGKILELRAHSPEAGSPRIRPTSIT